MNLYCYINNTCVFFHCGQHVMLHAALCLKLLNYLSELWAVTELLDELSSPGKLHQAQLPQIQL